MSLGLIVHVMQFITLNYGVICRCRWHVIMGKCNTAWRRCVELGRDGQGDLGRLEDSWGVVGWPRAHMDKLGRASFGTHVSLQTERMGAILAYFHQLTIDFLNHCSSPGFQ